ncbi:MAG: ABC transporter substrate-binding protein [Opitutales bacterium]|nr:ABC transporter substrate-binding protein [Opitutales bacterium]
MIKFPRFLFLAAVLLPAVLLLPGRAVAGPTAELRATVAEVLELLFPGGVAEDPVGVMPQVREIIDKRFDFDVIARRSLGRGWTRLSEEQRTTFSRLFADLLMYSYTDRLAGLSRPDIEWGSVQQLGTNRLEIASTIVYQGERYEVLYRLVEMRGDWQVYDLVIEGVSLVGNYRSQFTSVLDRRGPDELLRVLSERVDAQKGRSDG